MAKPALPQSIKTTNEILGKFFKQRNPLVEIPDNNVWKLRSDKFTSKAQDGKGEYTLWPFPIQSENYPFYLSFAIKLQPNGDIQEVNIKIFRENVIQLSEDGFIPTELLLRAEWSNDQPDNDSAPVHAQPHWHVHAVQVVDKMRHLPLPKQRIILDFIEEENVTMRSIMDEEDEEIPTESTSTIENEELPMFRFHLAMLAEWHKEAKTKPNNFLDNATLKIWLPQCLGYIREQLEYIVKKSPKLKPESRF